MAEEIRTTTDHAVIQEWVNQRGGRPAFLRGRDIDREKGVLRIDFPGYAGTEPLELLPWDDFFTKFERDNLAFRYQETTTTGQISRFYEFVHRTGASE